jgi:hypothetical protein
MLARAGTAKQPEVMLGNRRAAIDLTRFGAVFAASERGSSGTR